jgi:DNA-binding MarR family transcriptional regulator
MTPASRLEPERHAAFRIVSLANRISASASQAYLRCFGVGVMEWRVLAMIAVEPGISANGIAARSGLDKSSVSRGVHALVRKGDVEVGEDAADSRRSFLNLTASGQALHDRILKASLERERLLLDGLSDVDRGTLFGLLERLSRNMALVDAHEPSG